MKLCLQIAQKFLYDPETAGDGHVSFRREKYVANGGPDGGDGGRGGDLIFQVDPGVNTLNEFRHVRKYFAGNGEPGGKRRCHGADGKDMIIKVPAGTIVKKHLPDRLLPICLTKTRGKLF